MYELTQHLSPDKQCTLLVCKSARMNTATHRNTAQVNGVLLYVHTHVRPAFTCVPVVNEEGVWGNGGTVRHCIEISGQLTCRGRLL